MCDESMEESGIAGMGWLVWLIWQEQQGSGKGGDIEDKGQEER